MNKAIEEKLLAGLRSEKKIKPGLSGFVMFLVETLTTSELDELAEMENTMDEESCNAWLSEIMISTGRYSAAGGGYVERV